MTVLTEAPDAVPAPDFVVIDVETACSRASSICQVGIVGFRDGRELFEWETLVDPCDEFHDMNTRIHGIAAHHVIGQPTFAHIHDRIDRHLTGRVTVAHSFFDKSALAAACLVHDRAMIETTWLDSVRVAKRAWPELPNHKLGGLARFLGVAHRHHDALSDARAAGWVIVRAMEQTGMSLADWLAPPRRPGPAPRATAHGPLSGERVVIVGEPRDGPLAHVIAAHGGAVRSAMGSTTTMLILADDRLWLRSDPQTLKAEVARRNGQRVQIVTAAMLKARLES